MLPGFVFLCVCGLIYLPRERIKKTYTVFIYCVRFAVTSGTVGMTTKLSVREQSARSEWTHTQEPQCCSASPGAVCLGKFNTVLFSPAFILPFNPSSMKQTATHAWSCRVCNYFPLGAAGFLSAFSSVGCCCSVLL